MYMPTWITVPVWRSRDNTQEMALSFHCLGPRDQTHIVRLGSKHLYPCSHFTSPQTSFKMTTPTKRPADTCP